MTRQPAEQKRGGCLTTFLIAMLIINPLIGLYYLFAGPTLKETLPSLPEWRIPVLAMLALANFIFAIGIWNWKRWGVFGFAGSAFVAFLINTIQFGFPGALSGLMGVTLLAVLVVPVWNQME